MGIVCHLYYMKRFKRKNLGFRQLVIGYFLVLGNLTPLTFIGFQLNSPSLTFTAYMTRPPKMIVSLENAVISARIPTTAPFAL